MSDPCSGIDWSPSAAASAYSQLSGVLAAFVFSAIVLLLGWKNRDAISMRTLSLFLVTFLILSFASFCYGIVTGDSAPIACGRAYTVSAIAGGLLGLGVVMMVSGIAWLSSGYLQSEISKPKNGSKLTQYMSLLESVARLAVYGMASLVAAMLGVTIADYVRLVSASPGPYWASLVSPFVITNAAVVISYYKHRRKTNDEGDSETAGGLIFRISVLASIILALTDTIYAGVASEIPVRYWTPAPKWAIVANFASLAFTLLILVALVSIVPKFLHSGVLTKVSTD